MIRWTPVECVLAICVAVHTPCGAARLAYNSDGDILEQKIIAHLTE